jgi:ATP-binding cassette subfamily C protein
MSKDMNLFDIFKKEGLLHEAGGNRPFFLDRSDSLWLLESGKASVFSVWVENGDVVSARSHLFTAEPGSFLFGMDSGLHEKGIKLLAAGMTGARLYELGLSRLKELSEDPAYSPEIAGMIDGWAWSVSSGIGRGIYPKELKEPKLDEEMHVSSGESVYSKKEIVWIRHLEGSSLLCGRGDLPPVSAETLNWLPLSDRIWLQATDNSVVHSAGAVQIMREGAMWSSLEWFHSLVLLGVRLDSEKKEKAELGRLATKTDRDRRALGDALHRLASILEVKKDAHTVSAAEEDSLLAACKLVGNAIGVQFQPPPGASNGQGPGDPLLDIARSSRVRVRQVALKGRWWRTDSGPLLAYLEERKQPVALLPASAGRYNMVNPAERSTVKVTPENAASLNPFAYTFYRPFPETALSALDLLKFGFRDCERDFGFILLMGILGALLGLITPIATGIVFDSIIPGAEQDQLVQIVVILLACAFATAMFGMTRAIALLRMEAKMDSSVQAGIWDRLMALPVPFFRDYTSGDLANRSMGINAIRQILSGVTVTAILTSIFSLFSFALLFYYDWKLALVGTGLTLLSVACIVSVSYSQIRYQRKINELQGKATGIVLQFITGIAKLRVSGSEDRAFGVWARTFSEQKKLAYRSGLINNVLMSFNAILPVISAMAIFAWVAFKRSSDLSTGDFMAFNAAYGSFQGALIQMSTALTTSLAVGPLYERLKPIIQSLPEVDPAKAHPGQLAGAIEVSHVRFRYVPNGPLTLDDISLQVNPGEFVAFVGTSGSGKSTLFRLLLGFETPESGTVFYDGQDLSTVDVREVRRQIGVVLQNGRLMTGEIFKNIVGTSNLTLDDAWEAARMCGLSDDIKQMPMGMNTMISAGGGTLSGGQRQRLLIARAIVRKPKILFFDEATSALDNRTQAIVSSSLESLRATRIVIAHRLSTIIHADRIYVFDKGKIVESGGYEELLDEGGLFSELAKRQIA